MNLLSSFSLAFRGILANKVRSTLTMLGIVIGIASVIALMSVGQGVERSITAEIEDIGSNLLFVQPGDMEEDEWDYSGNTAANLTYEDAVALAEKNNAPAVAAVAPELATNSRRVAGNKNFYATVSGITPEYLNVLNVKMAEGKFIAKSDMDRRGLVCVLGSKVSEKLFEAKNPVGQTVRVDGRRFEVIGVMKPRGGMGSYDDAVMVPITTVMYRLNPVITVTGEHQIDYLAAQAIDEDSIDLASDQITELLRSRHRISEGKKDDFSIMSQKQLLNMVTNITQVLTMFLGAIAGISLLVGGIGIMNIMLVSVTERTREIGIRKAVGARHRDILMQFLIEAGALSLLAGIIGILFGWGLAEIVTSLRISLEGTPIETAITTNMVMLAVGVATAIGIVFGVGPALRAARLNPIDALRYE